MKTRNKSLLTIFCAFALVVGSVFGTYAYLTSQATVQNTFTVGNVTITMDETLTTEYGKPAKKVTEGGNELIKEIDVTANETADKTDTNKYKLVPGMTYTKDPTVHVDPASEDAWLFVRIQNGIADLEGTPTIASQMLTDLTAVTGTDGVYAYKERVTAGKDITVFTSFTIAGNANIEATAQYDPIIVSAYAVQGGFDSADAAWEAAPIEAWKTTTP